MADEKKPDGGDDRKKLMTVLVPAGGAAFVIILVAVILAPSDKSPDPSGKDKKGGPRPPGAGAPPPEGPGMPMPLDGSNGGTNDPGLKDIGGGLKARDLKEGTGPEVQPGSTAVVHYTGWLVNGHQFDSSRTRGKPFP